MHKLLHHFHTNYSSLRSCISITIYTQHVTEATLVLAVQAASSVQPPHTKRLAHFEHATLYTITLLVHQFLTASTLYRVSTNTSTTNTFPLCTCRIAQPFFTILHKHHMAIFQYSVLPYGFLHKSHLGFIHIHFHTFTLHSILSSIKLFNQFIFAICSQNQIIHI